MCSPFLGGGSIELHMAAQGIKVHGYDIFQPLTDFWQTMIDEPKNLAKEITYYHRKMNKQNFYDWQRMLPATSMDTAALFFALNKSSFSGSTYSGGFSLHNSTKRFTANAIQRVQTFHNPNLTVANLDFKQSIAKHDCFLYLDPPYLIDQQLYGKKGSTHAKFDHQTLADLLLQRDNWCRSYNNHPYIRELYKDCQIIDLSWTYGMSNNRSKSSEILIIK